MKKLLFLVPLIFIACSFRSQVEVAKELEKNGKINEAIEIYDKECKKGVSEACSNLYIIYKFGKGIDKDIKKANSYLKKSCELKNIDACFKTVDFLMEKNLTKEALGYLEFLCTLNSSEGCFYSGVLYSTRDDENSQKKTYEYYLKACELGGGAGCYNVGLFHEMGISGASRDMKMAISFYDRGCSLDNPNSCANLGVIYGEGKYIKKDREKAIEIFKKACEIGNQMACENVIFLNKK